MHRLTRHRRQRVVVGLAIVVGQRGRLWRAVTTFCGCSGLIRNRLDISHIVTSMVIMVLRL